jgi:hypothetical protein
LGSWISQKTLGYIPVYGVLHPAVELRKALLKNGWKPPLSPVEVHDIGKHEHEVNEDKHGKEFVDNDKDAHVKHADL